MPVMKIHLDATGIASEYKPEELIHVTEPMTIGVLEGGMESGKPSIAMLIPLPDGKAVVFETSLALFQTAARAFRAKFGDIA